MKNYVTNQEVVALDELWKWNEANCISYFKQVRPKDLFKALNLSILNKKYVITNLTNKIS